MTVGFFLRNKGICSINTSNVLDANPGIGGSEYEILCISYLLSLRKNNIDIILYVEEDGFFPDMKCKVVKDLENCVNSCLNDNVEILIIDYKHHEKEIINKTENNLKYFIWAHNFILYKDLQYFSSKKNIVRIVHVGKESLDLYRDHKSFNKSIFIYNGIPVKELNFYLEKFKLNKARENKVVYLGSLVPVKGFHLIARTWKNVLKKIPDAQLYVIGNGKLYDRNSKLGTYEIAEETYENEFIGFVTDENKNILPSVHFLGALGIEKNDVLKDCKVGVPNPSGNTETFGISALEMQLMGCEIVTIKCPGFIDTVNHSKFLYKNKRQLESYLIKALKQSTINDNYTDIHNYIKENFSFENILVRWEFELSNYKENLNVNLDLKNNFHLKRIKEILRITKVILPFMNIIPPLELFWNFKKKFAKLFKK
tara:strand:+ start:2205 stop:3482 length:1278 start_codon:yes stop_codon:yes gene_type:complete